MIQLFQINRLVPIVRNMFQTERRILRGFINSLISKDLLVTYTWSGRSENGSKHSFADLIHIQSALFNAMFSVVPSYSIAEFEDDFKAYLVKLQRANAIKFKASSNL